MSYYAKGDGYIVLKKTILTKKNLEKLWRRSCSSGLTANTEDNVTWGWSMPKTAILQTLVNAIGEYATGVDFPFPHELPTVRLCHPYGNYHEDSVMDFLDIFTPFVREGEFELLGEDDAMWRFHFRNGKWREDSGEVWYHTKRMLFVEAVDKFGVIADIDGARHQLSRKEIRTLVAGGAFNRDPVANLVLPKLLTKYGKCFECDNSTCRLNPDGICLAPLLTGKSPFHNGDLDDCQDYVPLEDN